MKYLFFLFILFSCTNPYQSANRGDSIEPRTVEQLDRDLNITNVQLKNQAFEISTLVTKDSLKSIQMKALIIDNANKTTLINNLKKEQADFKIVNDRTITALKKSDSIFTVRDYAFIKDSVAQWKKINGLSVASAGHYSNINMLLTDKKAKDKSLLIMGSRVDGLQIQVGSVQSKNDDLQKLIKSYASIPDSASFKVYKGKVSLNIPNLQKIIQAEIRRYKP